MGVQLRGGGAHVFVARACVALLLAGLCAVSVPRGERTATAATRSTATTVTTTTVPPTSTSAPAPPPPPPLPPLGPDIEHANPATVRDGRPTVVLTFDDGPHPFFTPRVLDVLASRGVKAVFCVVGTEVARYRHLVARIAAEGHALCNHSENHDIRMSVKDPAYVAAMLRHPSDLIRDITGTMPAYYRGPGGDLSVFIIEEAHRLGMRILGWSIDPADYFTPGPQTIQDRVMSRIHPGAVVLLHDAGGERSQTVQQLAGLIDRLHAAGYSLVLP